MLKEITAAKNVFSPQRICIVNAFTGPTNSAGSCFQSTPREYLGSESRYMHIILSGGSTVSTGLVISHIFSGLLNCVQMSMHSHE